MRLIRKWRTYETEEIPQEEIEKLLNEEKEKEDSNRSSQESSNEENSADTQDRQTDSEQEAESRNKQDSLEANTSQADYSEANENGKSADQDNDNGENFDGDENESANNSNENSETADTRNDLDADTSIFEETFKQIDEHENNESVDDSECDNYDDYDDDYDYEYDCEDDYEYYGERDENKAFDLITNLTLKRLGTTFAQLVEHVAEERSIEDTKGYDVWDTRKLLQRTLNPQIPLSACKKGKKKEKIVLLLDTSGSCEWLADFYAQIAKVASEYDLVEIYEAPNGVICWKWNEKKKEWMEVPETENWNELFQSRIIIFFGDFDGGDSVVEASWKNTVYWFSSENRYVDMDEHSWCHYTLADFKGEYFECYGVEDFMKNVKKILKKPVWR